MNRIMLKSKIHRATLTGADLHYEGSIAIDKMLMEKADLVPGEQVHVLDVDNGARLVTYVIEGDAGAGDVILNGAAARLATVGDKVIILSYCSVDESELPGFSPTMVLVDEQNNILQQCVNSPVLGNLTSSSDKEETL
jgi:aspartate 1-decarboxylase